MIVTRTGVAIGCTAAEPRDRHERTHVPAPDLDSFHAAPRFGWGDALILAAPVLMIALAMSGLFR